MRWQLSLGLLLVGCAAFLLCANTASGQAVYGSIVGTVSDPQGNAVRDAMRHLGMPEVRSVRIGKYMEIDIEGQNSELESRLHQLCHDLLSNPVIEDYELQKPNGAQSKVKPKKKGSK